MGRAKLRSGGGCIRRGGECIFWSGVVSGEAVALSVLVERRESNKVWEVEILLSWVWNWGLIGEVVWMTGKTKVMNGAVSVWESSHGEWFLNPLKCNIASRVFLFWRCGIQGVRQIRKHLIDSNCRFLKCRRAAWETGWGHHSYDESAHFGKFDSFSSSVTILIKLYSTGLSEIPFPNSGKTW